MRLSFYVDLFTVIQGHVKEGNREGKKENTRVEDQIYQKQGAGAANRSSLRFTANIRINPYPNRTPPILEESKQDNEDNLKI